MPFQGFRRKAPNRHRGTPVARGLLWVLLAFDAVFVALHLVHKLGPGLLDYRFSLEQDGGHAEIFQYAKTFWIALLLGGLFVRTRQAVYAAWSMLFAYLLCDDSLQIHERVGTLLARHRGLPGVLGIPPEDLGQLLFLLAIGGLFLMSLALAHRRSSESARRSSADLVVLLGALVVCGLLLDTVHAAMQPVPVLRGVLAVLEDGGELVVMSLICAYVHGLRSFGDRASGALWDAATRPLPPPLRGLLDRIAGLSPEGRQRRQKAVTEAPDSLRH